MNSLMNMLPGKNDNFIYHPFLKDEIDLDITSNPHTTDTNYNTRQCML